jgi:hypothetical protein
VTVDQAARALGLSVDAIRKRVQRGTIPYEKDPAGRVTILLDSQDAHSTLQDEVRDEVLDAAGHSPGPDTPPDQLLAAKDELVEELRDRVRALEEANRENRRIIAGLIQRVPELAPPRDEPHGPETVAEEPEGTDASTDQVDRETGVQRRSSWWRRFFGFDDRGSG